jgi:DNA-binding PadR family transcriptional regulator
MVSDICQGGNIMARKNTLRYILLGLLSKKRMSGYDLRQSFQNEIGEFWQAQHSQIYPELAKMEDNGLITHAIKISGEKLEKKIYQLTPDGENALKEWIHTATDELPVNRDEFVLKLFFISDIHDPALIDIVQQQYDLHEAKRHHLVARERALFPTASDQEANYGHYLILAHAINRETEYTGWLQQVLAKIQVN